MKVWIVTESMFGNTRQIAERIADGLRSSPSMEIEVLDAGKAPFVVPEDLALLIVGAPTHVLGLPRASSRAEAVKRGSPVRTLRGVREWLDQVRFTSRGTPAACFDTRVDRPLVSGSAARSIARRLRRSHCRMVSDSMS